MSESFLTPELQVAISKGYELTVIPVNRSEIVRNLPEKVHLDCSISDSSTWYKIKAFFLIVQYIPYVSVADLSKCLQLGYMLDAIKYLYASNLVYLDLKKRARLAEREVFYSYWLSYVPIAFSLYKLKEPQTRNIFVARGHGSDIYASAVGVHYPFRNLIFKWLDGISVISAYGKEFLEEKYPESRGKIHLSRLGVFDNYQKKNSTDDYRIVSCSSIISLKRVPLLFKSISSYADANPDKKIEWTHIGDGPMMGKLVEEIKANKRDNLECVLKGTLTNEEIMKLYKDTPYKCFVLLSTTEGIPVSIMEAIASGIPVIATNVGGVREIVNAQTGRLLDKDFTQEAFDMALNDIYVNNACYSESAYEYFSNNYNAISNFGDFYDNYLNML